MSKGKVSIGVTVALFASLLLPILSAAPAAAATLNVNYGIQGCDLGTATSYNQLTATCSQDGYGNGNLGKDWNELDLVPFQVSLNNNGNTAQSGNFVYAGDYIKAAGDALLGKFGWDFVSTLTLNTGESDAGCPINPAESGVTITPPGGDIGGADRTIYRSVSNITIPSHTECVYDYYMRLAVGASRFSGSNLQGYVLNESLGSQGVGERKRSIPVNEILPQDINKTMTGVQDSDVIWSIDKSPNPATWDFGNVCDTTNLNTSLPVDVTVTWDKEDAVQGGDITIHTLVEATNPAARVITVQVTDSLRSGSTELQSHTGVATDIPANTANVNVLEYTTTIPGNTPESTINDIATATYTDKLTGVPVPGKAFAVFPPFSGSPPVQEAFVVGDGITTNDTANISDSETINGAGLSFTLDSVTGDADAIAGQSITGSSPGPVEWTSGPVSNPGEVVLHKTVTLDPSVGATSGSLDDTAAVTGVDGFTTSVDASTTLESSLAGSLVINKETSIPVDPGTTFEFTVNPGGIIVPVVIGADGKTGSSDPVTGLTAGDYTVSETDTQGFPPADDQNFTIGAGACTAELFFVNTAGPATATATKITFPAGFEADWKFTVTLDGNPFDTGTSDITGAVQWDNAASDTLTLDEGTYTITETTQDGWVLDPITVNDNGNGSGTTDATSCSFTVNLPADTDGVFDCSFTNTKLGSITLVKETVPSPDLTGTSFEFERDFGSATVNLGDGDSDTVKDLPAGTYSAKENTPAGWDLLTFTCGDGSQPDAIDLGVGEDVTCTARNTQQTGTITVVKVTDPDPDTTDTDFPFVSDFMGNFPLKNGDSKTSDPLTVNGGPYSVSETAPAGWDLDSFTCDNGDDPSEINVTSGGNVVCTATNVQRGTIIVKKITDPANSTQKFTFTGDAAGTIDNTGNITVNNLKPGDYTSTETAVSGWDLTKIECDDANSTGTGSTANFKLDPGETVTCTFTNKQQTGNIIIKKVTDPTTSTQKFVFKTNYGPDLNLGNGEQDNSGQLPIGNYSVSETVPAGWDLKSFICDDQSLPSAISLQANETVTCTATNVQRGAIDLTKTFSKGVPPAGSSYDFTLRTGASQGNPGTVVPGGSVTLNGANNFHKVFQNLVPGDYQLCESGVPAGGHSSLEDLPGAFVPDPLDNSTVCAPITVGAGQTVTITIDNTPPPGGDQRTIGYWKNWSSCKTSGGKQAPVLDQTLFKATQAGQTIVIGTLSLPGGATANNAGLSCTYARNILDKTTIDGKKKVASDPLFNMAAQLLAAKLNVAAGAGVCPAATTAIKDGQDLLVKYGWNGLTYSPKLTAADAAKANTLNGILDSYNNGNLCP